MATGSRQAQRLFDYTYEMVFSLLVDSRNKKQHVGNKRNRRCRYCRHRRPDTTFKSEPHAIPEFLGNHRLFTWDECDCCNCSFSNFEQDFSRYLLPFRIVTGLRGKKKRSTSRSRYTDMEHSGGRVRVVPNEDDAIEVDYDDKSLTIKHQRQPYRPLGIYKCLTKIAISVMPEDEIPRFSNTCDWLRSEDYRAVIPGNTLPVALMHFLPGPRRDGVGLRLWRRRPRHDRHPYIVSVLYTGNFCFQTVVPNAADASDHVNDYVFVDLSAATSPFEIYGPPLRNLLDLSSPDFVRGEVVWLPMVYTSVVKSKVQDGLKAEDDKIDDFEK